MGVGGRVWVVVLVGVRVDGVGGVVVVVERSRIRSRIGSQVWAGAGVCVIGQRIREVRLALVIDLVELHRRRSSWRTVGNDS